MAKIVYKAGRANRTSYHARKVGIHAEIDQVPYKSGWKMRACMWVSGAKAGSKAGGSMKVQTSLGCGTGKNPRQALAAAARNFAKRVAGGGIRGVMATGRSGAFAGLKG